MKKLLDQFHINLESLVGLHRKLLDLLRMEKEALIAAELKKVQEVTNAKEVLLNDIQASENDRQKLVSELSIVMKVPRKDLKLSRLIVEIQADFQKHATQFRSALNALSFLIQRITEQNKENASLVKESMRHIERMKQNVLSESKKSSEVYSKSGSRVNPARDSRLISKEI